LAITCAAIPLLFLWTQKSRIDRFVGELSYPVYISHMLVIILIESCLAARSIADLKTLSLYAPLVFACTAVVSVGLLKLVIDPCERYRQARVSRVDVRQPSQGSTTRGLTGAQSPSLE